MFRHGPYSLAVVARTSLKILRIRLSALQLHDAVESPAASLAYPTMRLASGFAYLTSGGPPNDKWPAPPGVLLNTFT